MPSVHWGESASTRGLPQRLSVLVARSLIGMATPKTGSAYTYSGDVGLAAAARVADPDITDELPTEMAALDMAPGTEVTVDGYDKDRDLVLVGWCDSAGTPRVTSVAPEHFAASFVKG